MDTENEIRVVIADDNPKIRQGVRKLLEVAPEITIIGEACNGQEAIEMVEQLHPHILLLDLQMPVMDGVETIDYLQKCITNVKILVLSGFYDKHYTAEVLTHGAWGYYLKEEAPAVLVDAIRQAARGDGQGSRPRPSQKLVNRLAGLS